MKELGDFIKRCEQEGELLRIKKEVDWYLELGHVAKLSEERKGPALLFENVKDFDIPVLTSAFTTTRRFAIALDMPLDSSICDMAKKWMELTTQKPIEAKIVDSGPVCEMVIEGDEVDIEALPAPHYNPLDGGRFIGTASYLVTQDKETGWTNCGTYRMQIHDRNHCGIQIIKGKHADFHFNQHKKDGTKMPAAAVIGADAVHFLVSSTLVSAQMDEYNIISTLRQEPCEVFVSDLTDVDTLWKLDIWINTAFRFGSEAAFIFLANKSDLKEREFEEEEIEQFAKRYRGRPFITSAKTGENVERAFQTIGQMILNREFARRFVPMDSDLEEEIPVLVEVEDKIMDTFCHGVGEYVEGMSIVQSVFEELGIDFEHPTAAQLDALVHRLLQETKQGMSANEHDELEKTLKGYLRKIK